MFIINKNIIKLVTFLLFTLGIAISAHAVPIDPISYDMQNGQSGSYTYWDEYYSGTGSTTTNLASLSGGLGDLTDGIIANTNWNLAEAPPGNGPYVGWSINPTITFHFGAPVSIDSITFYVDDPNGYGGVYAPSGFIINGIPYIVSDPAGSAPTSFTFSNLGLNLSDLTVTVNKRNNGWVFLSEVDFDGNSAAAVPEPSTLLLLGSGLVGLGYFIRRRRG